MPYFDNAATTPVGEDALQAFVQASRTYWANPSSLHREGLAARAELEADRKAMACLLGVAPGTLTYTASATEADSLVVESLFWARQPGEVVVPAFEHSALTGWTGLLRQKGWRVIQIPAPKGYLDPDAVAAALTPDTRLVCCMVVNNVIGTIQPVEEIVRRVRAKERETGRPIHVHADATQALGKIPLDLTALGVDSAAFSAHKIYGPKGVGLLYNRDASVKALSPGGGQEHALRPGTENLPGIAAFTVALRNAVENLPAHMEHVARLNAIVRNRLADVPHIRILSPASNSSPWILLITNDLLPSEVLTRMLYDAGYCVSAGSACSNNTRSKQMTVMEAMRFGPDDARGAFRVSFGIQNTEEEAEGLCDTLRSILGGSR